MELGKRLARLTKINAWRWLFCLNTTFVLPKLDGWCVVCHYGAIYIMYVKGCGGQVGRGKGWGWGREGNLLGRRRFLFFCLFLCSLNCKFAVLKAVYAACRTVRWGSMMWIASPSLSWSTCLCCLLEGGWTDRMRNTESLLLIMINLILMMNLL